jgi:hypothetical protein
MSSIYTFPEAQKRLDEITAEIEAKIAQSAKEYAAEMARIYEQEKRSPILAQVRRLKRTGKLRRYFLAKSDGRLKAVILPANEAKR